MTETETKNFADDISEASTYAQTTILNETKAYIKENHKYHSTRDFKKAHPKNLNELKAEKLIEKGYRKASEVAREIFEEIESCIWSETQYGDSKLCFEINSAKYKKLKKKYIE